MFPKYLWCSQNHISTEMLAFLNHTIKNFNDPVESVISTQSLWEINIVIFCVKKIALPPPTPPTFTIPLLTSRQDRKGTAKMLYTNEVYYFSMGKRLFFIKAVIITWAQLEWFRLKTPKPWQTSWKITIFDHRQKARMMTGSLEST